MTLYGSAQELNGGIMPTSILGVRFLTGLFKKLLRCNEFPGQSRVQFRVQFSKKYAFSV